MNIFAPRGHLVLVSKTTAHNGYDSHAEDIEESLKIGKLYTIVSTDVGGSSTSIQLKEFPNKIWNSVNFIDYVAAPKEIDFNEENELGDEPLFCKAAYEFAVRKWRVECKEQIEARAMYKEGVIKLSDSEIIVSSVRAQGKNTNGCIRHRKDMMVSYQKEGSSTIFDLFLTYDQAKNLYNEMAKGLNEIEDE